MEKKYTWKTAVCDVVMVLLALLFLYPIILIAMNSVKEGSSIVSTLTSLPKELHIQNYIDAYTKLDYGKALLRSVLIAGFTVIGVVFFSSMAAYKLVRCASWKSSKIIMVLLLSSAVIPIQVLMIPLVITARQLSLINTLHGMMMIYIGGSMAMAIFLYIGFVGSIPLELEEAAIVDGAGPFKIFYSIVFPLLKPMTATVTIMVGMGTFNDFMMQKLILLKSDLGTLQVAMQKFYDAYQTDWAGVMAGLVLSMLPMIVFFLFFQKQIMSGMLSGAVKG